MQRGFLKGLIGDAINAIVAAAGSNLLKLLRELKHPLILCLRYAFSGQDSGRRDNRRPVMVPLV
jgi:hypothetical protein